MDKCINHPLKVARGRCKSCHRPLCDDCKYVTSIGIFCGEECHLKAKEFMDRVSPDLPPPRRRSFIKGKTIKGIIVLAILLAILYAVMYFRYDATSVDDIISVFRGWMKAVF
jgi:hypothetical protein